MVGRATHGDVADSRHGWRVLVILSTLMGFASISTDLFLPAIPTMAATSTRMSGRLN